MQHGPNFLFGAFGPDSRLARLHVEVLGQSTASRAGMRACGHKDGQAPTPRTPEERPTRLRSSLRYRSQWLHSLPFSQTVSELFEIASWWISSPRIHVPTPCHKFFLCPPKPTPLAGWLQPGALLRSRGAKADWATRGNRACLSESSRGGRLVRVWAREQRGNRRTKHATTLKPPVAQRAKDHPAQ